MPEIEKKNAAIVTDAGESGDQKATLQKTNREIIEEEAIAKVKEQREQQNTPIITDGEIEAVKETVPATKEPESSDLVTIIVDGVEKEVPRDEVLKQGINTMQKQSTAELRLQLAAKRNAEINDRERKLQLNQQEFIQQQQEQVKKQLNHDTKTFGQEFEQAIFGEGDNAEEGQVASMITKVLDDQSQLRELVAESNQRAVSAEQRAEQVKMTLQKQVMKERQALAGSFADKYENIDNDPRLRGMANDRTVVLMREHPEWSDNKIVMQAGEDVNSWLKSVGQPTSTPTDLATEKKRSMVRQPESVGARSPSKPTIKRKTAADILREERLSRGQPV